MKTFKQHLNELKKSTLASYVKGAMQDRELSATGASFRSGKAGHEYNKAKETPKEIKREKGIDVALKKLSKEEVEQLQELSPETKASYIEKSKEAIKSLKPYASKSKFPNLATNIIKRREKGLKLAQEDAGAGGAVGSAATGSSGPTNAVGSGAIAGAGVGKYGEPGVYLNKKKKKAHNPVMFSAFRRKTPKL